MVKRIYLSLFVLILFIIGCAPSNLIQTTDTVFMISPDDFAYNKETAASNAFQHNDAPFLKTRIQAMEQFNAMVEKLQSENIRVIQTKSRKDIETPDAVFPNNWFSTHRDGENGTLIVVYPMLTQNRRAEVRINLLKKKLKENGIKISRTIDLTHYCKQNKALEGTGSMVLDRIHKVAFASLSPRTNREVLEDFCNKLGYRSVVFHSYDKRKLIYHSNVMMSVGSDFAVICAEGIKEGTERKMVLNELKELGKRIIEISLEQMKHMCGNILELHSINGKKIIIMSTSAYNHFSVEQKKELEKSGTVLPFNVHTIENIGGGSVRCMVAEIFYNNIYRTNHSTGRRIRRR